MQVDAQPDISAPKDGYPNAHTMVLGSLLGYGDSSLSDLMENPQFKVLDEYLFHSTYFANPNLVGDGAAGGKMTMERLSEILYCIENYSNIVGFTVAEYLPFDEHKLHKIFAGIKMFMD